MGSIWRGTQALTTLILGLIRFCAAFAAVIVVTTAYSNAVSAEEKAEQPVLLALGTSLTAGYGLPESDSFTFLLSKQLEADGLPIRIINGGVSGDTSAGGLARVDWLLDNTVTHVLIELGSNDALRGLAPTKTEENLEQLIKLLQDRGLKVMLAGMLAPPNLGPDYGTAFNGIYPRLAEKYQIPLYPFFLDGVAAERELNQADGIHPNAAGSKVIVDRIAPSVLSFLKGEDIAGLIPSDAPSPAPTGDQKPTPALTPAGSS